MILPAKESSIDVLTNYVQKNQEKLYRLAYSYLKNQEMALDVVQDAIVKALSKIHTLRDEAYVTTWFYRILINECLTCIKKNKMKDTLNLEDYELEIHEENENIGIEIYQWIDELKPKWKTVIILRYFEDMKFEDIARITNTNISTVKTRLYKAVNELKQKAQQRKIEE